MNDYTNKDIINFYQMEIDHLADNTKDKYLLHVKNLFKYLENKSIVDIDYIDLQNFLKGLFDKKNTVTSINNVKSGLNSFFKYCKKSGINSRDLHLSTNKDKEKKNRDKDKIRINSEMYYNIIESSEYYYSSKEKLAMRDIKERIILYLFLYGGLRRCEIRNLKLQDIKKSVKDEIVRLEVNIINSKRDKDRKIFLSEKVYLAMKEWLETRLKVSYTSDYIFCTENDRKMSKDESTLPRLATRVSKRANIKIEGNYEMPILFTPHDFRHACGSMLAKKGVPAIEIAKFLGDTLEVVLKVYIHKDTSASYDVADCLM